MNPQALNRYSYVENDPVNHIDPSGLKKKKGFFSRLLKSFVRAIPAIVTAVVVAAVVVATYGTALPVLIVAGALAGAAAGAVNTAVNGGDLATNVLLGAALGAIGGAVGGPLSAALQPTLGAFGSAVATGTIMGGAMGGVGAAISGGNILEGIAGGAITGAVVSAAVYGGYRATQWASSEWNTVSPHPAESHEYVNAWYESSPGQGPYESSPRDVLFAGGRRSENPFIDDGAGGGGGGFGSRWRSPLPPDAPVAPNYPANPQKPPGAGWEWRGPARLWMEEEVGTTRNWIKACIQIFFTRSTGSIMIGGIRARVRGTAFFQMGGSNLENDCRQLELGSDARAYVKECLAEGMELAAQLMTQLDFDRGTIFTLVPPGAEVVQLHDFKSGFLPEPPSDTHRHVTAEDGRSWRVVPTPSTDECLAQFIHSFLSNGTDRVCILENGLARPDDPWIATSELRVLMLGDHVYHALVSDDASKTEESIPSRIDKTIWRVNAVYPPAVAVLVSSSPEYAALNMRSRIDEADVAVFAGRATHVIVGAFDGEGYVIWERSST